MGRYGYRRTFPLCFAGLQAHEFAERKFLRADAGVSADVLREKLWIGVDENARFVA